MSTVLITGISGFTGRHLTRYLTSRHRGMKIFGLCRNPAHPVDGAELLFGDVRDPVIIKNVVSRTRPDYVFHLAGCNRGNYSEIFSTNVIGTINLLETLKETGNAATRILLVGSVSEYGMVREGIDGSLPVRESYPLNPITFYGNSKVAQYHIAMQYHTVHKMRIIVARPSNIIGIEQSDNYVISAFAKQIAEIEGGLKPGILYVGNLDPQRDFVDISDAVDAYWKLIASECFGQVFNVCSAAPITIKDTLDYLLMISNIDPHVRVDPAKVRSHDVILQRYSYDGIMSLTGWTPKIDYRKTLRDVLEYWRAVVNCR